MISRRILAAVLLLCATQAHAQTGSIKTPAQLSGQINALFPDNTIGRITPFDARQITLNQVTSTAFLNSANFFSAFNVFDLNAAPLPTPQAGSIIQIGNLDSVISRLEVDAFGASIHFTGLRSEGTAAAPTAVMSGSEIASFNAGGYNSAAWVEPRAAFHCYANQTWTTSANGTHCDIAVTANGDVSQAELIRFENDGGITVPSTVAGGDKGAGTINAGGIFINGTAAIPFNGNIGAATGTSLVAGPTDLAPAVTNRITVSNSSATTLFATGQDATHSLEMLWLYNATPANAAAQIATFGYTNPLTIDASVLTLQGLSGGALKFGSNTVALGGNLTTAGAFALSGAFGFTGTLTGATNVTFPTSGTLATTAGINAALPSAATSQIYGGSGSAGQAAVLSTLPAAAFPTLTGDVTTTAGSTATTLGNAPVIAKVLTGFTSGAGTVSATDSILSALQKINGNVALKLPLAGGTMSGNIAMGGNAITGGGAITGTAISGTSYAGLPVGTNSAEGVLQCDGSTTTCSGGKITSVGAGGGVSSFNTKTGVVTTAVVVQKFTASGTYTPTAGMLHAVIECVGAGAGGGGATSVSGTIFAGGGGGSGGYSRLLATAATIGASQTVTIGAAGAAGTASTNGGSGGATSVGSLCVANGGIGGTFGSATSVPAGGGGATSGTGDIAAAGAPGINGFYNGVNNTITGGSGAGGSSVFGGGGVGSVGATPGAGSNYGSGGGGGYNTAGGAAGSGGFVIVTEYINL